MFMLLFQICVISTGLCWYDPPQTFADRDECEAVGDARLIQYDARNNPDLGVVYQCVRTAPEP